LEPQTSFIQPCSSLCVRAGRWGGLRGTGRREAGVFICSRGTRSPGFHQRLSLSEHLNSCLGLSAPPCTPPLWGKPALPRRRVATSGSERIHHWEARLASLNGPGRCVYKIHNSLGLHRTTESQNSRGWKGPLWVI